jgi:hypothetical protein
MINIVYNLNFIQKITFMQSEKFIYIPASPQMSMLLYGNHILANSTINDEKKSNEFSENSAFLMLNNDIDYNAIENNEFENDNGLFQRFVRNKTPEYILKQYNALKLFIMNNSIRKPKYSLLNK